ncbi:hypothetical protein M1P56_18640 [Streptomyces sp. HU2014]|uniref:glycosyltransferase n=1 Tax=Streptomyces sp. HU2014 TaxID=2939414 RepID=UPI0020106B24|nr:nucleotide disphospho-sugar-binding domain-containing protein [Streptomyces sp. HU2014]UQI46212.1 hypothetical protein M1P56_18640 [Streptomyces sp. HU2014]
MHSPTPRPPAAPQRVLLATWGSTGDIAPYAGLAVALEEAGHRVTVVTSNRYAPVFRRHRLTVRAMPLDAQEATIGPHRTRRARIANAAHMADVSARCLLDAAREGADVLLAHPLLHPLAAVIGKGLRVPCVGAYTVSHAMMLPALISGTPRRRYTVTDGLTRLILSPVYRTAAARLRRELDVKAGLADAVAPPSPRHPVRYGFAPALLPPGLPLPSGHRAVGPWHPPFPADWRPDDRLTDFLRSGPPPVYFGFGSMNELDNARVSRAIEQAVQRLGIRAVVQGGWAELDVPGDDILNIGECPHSWLLPRMAAAVHHAGAGTTHACLRSRTPALPVPVRLDQPFWASRLHALGLTPGVTPMRRLDGGSLTAGLARLLADPGYRERTHRTGEVVAGLDGTAAVLQEVDRLGRDRG